MDAIDPLGESTAKPPPQRVCEIGLQGIVEAIRLIVTTRAARRTGRRTQRARRSMSQHPKFLTQDSTQRGRRLRTSSRQRPSQAGSRLETRTSPCSDADRKERIDSAKHRGAFRADETGRQQVTSAGYQTYRHARVSTITTRTIIKLISAHKLSVRLLPLLSLCIVMTSLQDASPTVYW